jgi:DNA-binding beta-propeller fold protein YncE
MTSLGRSILFPVLAAALVSCGSGEGGGSAPDEVAVTDVAAPVDPGSDLSGPADSPDPGAPADVPATPDPGEDAAIAPADPGPDVPLPEDVADPGGPADLPGLPDPGLPQDVPQPVDPGLPDLPPDAGPFAFSLAVPPVCASCQNVFSLVRGESRRLPVTVTLAEGEPADVALSIASLPAGVSAAFDPPSVTPTGVSFLTITASDAAAPAKGTATVTASGGGVVRTLDLAIEVRSHLGLSGPAALVLEAGGATLLATEADRLVRVRADTRAVVATIASALQQPRGIALEAGGASALVATSGQDAGLVRVDLATGVVASVCPALKSPWGVAIEAGGATALVTDCGAEGDCGSKGRLVRVDLATAVVTPVTPTALGLKYPRGVAIEAGGAHALVVEQGGAGGQGSPARILRVTLASGGVKTVASEIPLPNYPQAIVIEEGGGSALVSNAASLVRVDLKTGAKSPVSAVRPGGCCAGVGADFGFALEAGGKTALFGDASLGAIVRLNVDTPARSLAPAEGSEENMLGAASVAFEAGEATALVTAINGPGRLMRADLATGRLARIGQDFTWMLGAVPEPGGVNALVFAQDQSTGEATLFRTALADGATTPFVTGFQYGRGLALDGAGTGALVLEASRLTRVALPGGAATSVPIGVPCLTTPVEEAGGTVLSVEACEGGLYRVSLADGSSSQVAAGLFGSTGTLGNSTIDLMPDGQSALLLDCSLGRLLRVDLATGRFAILGAQLNCPRGLAVAADGKSALVGQDYALYRFALDGPLAPVSVAQDQRQLRRPVLEAGGATALVLDCATGDSDCTSQGRVSRVTLATGAVTPLVTGLNFQYARGGALALLDATHALVADCGSTPGSCDGSSGRVMRADLSTGTRSTLESGFEQITSIVVEGDGTTALVLESGYWSGSGRISRMTVADGSYAVVASGFSNARQIELEAGGLSAILVSGGGLARLVLATGVVTQLAPNLELGSFALEAGGQTALAAGGGGNGSWGLYYRIRLDTGAIDVLNPGMGLFNAADGIALEAGGLTALVAEATEIEIGPSTLLRVPVPQP